MIRRFLAVLILALSAAAANASVADKTTSYISSTDSSWETLVQRNVGYSATDGISTTRSQTVSPRAGYPAATIEQVAKMAPAVIKTAGVILARTSPLLATALIAGGSLDWFYDQQGQLVKPSGGNSHPSFPQTGTYYQYCRNGNCIYLSSGSSPSAAGGACASGYLCNWSGQTVLSWSCTGTLPSSWQCSYVYKIGNDGPYNWYYGQSATLYSVPGCPPGYNSQGGNCVYGAPSPVTDTDIQGAITNWAQSNAEAVMVWLKQNGKWAPGNYLYDQDVKRLFGTQYVATKTTTAANGTQQTTTVTTKPMTEVKCNSSGCTITAGQQEFTLNADGSSSTETKMSPEATPSSESSSNPSPNPVEIPDDYARENTLQDIRDKLEFENSEQPQTETIASVLDTFKARLAALPIIGAAFSIGNIGGSGQCPPISIELFSETISTDVHCELMETVTSMLSPVFHALWLVLGLVIVLSA